jgi:hypothetical protein
VQLLWLATEWLQARANAAARAVGLVWLFSWKQRKRHCFFEWKQGCGAGARRRRRGRARRRRADAGVA